LKTAAVATGNGAGIGESSNGETSKNEQLIISGGHITAQGAASGIGGLGVQSLNLSGPAVFICDSSQLPVTAGWIVLRNGFLLFVTEGSRLFNVSSYLSNDADLAILFRSETEANVEPLENLTQTLLHIGNLELPVETLWSFCVSGADFKRCFGNESTRIKSMIVSVPSIGSYSIEAFGAGLAGLLEDSTGSSKFEVDSRNTFIANARFVFFHSDVPTKSVSDTSRSTEQIDFSLTLILAIALGSFFFLVILHRVIIAIICRNWKRQEEPSNPSAALALSLVDLQPLTGGSRIHFISCTFFWQRVLYFK
jgi:hypothetical protein